MPDLSRPEIIAGWICRIVAAVILLQTLYFKFTGAPESVYIFTRVGMEPWGRIGSGVAELLAAALLFVPGLGWLGAALSLGVMAGAIGSHLTVLGIEVQGDHGLLFGLAVVVACCSLTLLYIEKAHIPFVGAFLNLNSK